MKPTLIGMFYGSQLQAMLPKLHSTNFAGMELIRPMYCVHEDSIKAWCRYNGHAFIQCACRFTEQYKSNGNENLMSKRQEIKDLIKDLKKTNPNIENSIFKSIHAVCLDTMPGYNRTALHTPFLKTTDSYKNALRLVTAGHSNCFGNYITYIFLFRLPYPSFPRRRQDPPCPYGRRRKAAHRSAF